MDLLPLVRDGVASQDSIHAVEAHIAACESCRALFSGDAPPPANPAKAFESFRRNLQFTTAMLLMFGLFFGVSLTAGEGLFYNTLIMPVLGGLGYCLFRRKALYAVPLLTLVAHFAINLLELVRGVEHLDVLSVVMWSAIYSIFSVLGTIAAWLLHFAFRKER